MSKKNFLWGKICWIHEIAASGKMLRSVPPVIVIRLPVGTERRRQQSKLERRSKTNVEENESKYREGISWRPYILVIFPVVLETCSFLITRAFKIDPWLNETNLLKRLVNSLIHIIDNTTVTSCINSSILLQYFFLLWKKAVCCIANGTIHDGSNRVYLSYWFHQKDIDDKRHLNNPEWCIYFYFFYCRNNLGSEMKWIESINHYYL